MRTSFGTNIVEAQRKRVWYTGDSTIREGMPLCYDFDTTDNILGYDKAAGGLPGCQTTPNTTAEGNQNEGKYLRVEDPVAEDNQQWLAGYVAGTSEAGKAGPRWLDIFVPNGAIIPVRTDASCTVGVTILGLADGETLLQLAYGSDDPMCCAIAMETVDRSQASGIVLAKCFPTGQVISGLSAHFMPSNIRNGRTYGFTVDGENFFKGIAGAQEYLVHLVAWKATASTGDCYGGMLKIKGINEGVNANTYIWRGLNCAAHNEGTVGWVENVISINNESGGTATRAVALAINAENYGTTGEMGCCDMLLRDEGTSTESYILRLRNDDRSAVGEVGSVFKIEAVTESDGFDVLFDFEDLVDLGSLYIEDSNASPDKAGSIKITTPAGATAYINVYDGVRA